MYMICITPPYANSYIFSGNYNTVKLLYSKTSQSLWNVQINSREVNIHL
jgi:hypothetical protein